MKKKSLSILALFLTGALLAGCSFDKNNSSSKPSDDGQEEGNWSEDIQADMLNYFGEVLPYAPLGN